DEAQTEVVLINGCGQQQIDHGFGAAGIEELDDSALNLEALIHQEYFASRQLGAANDHGIRSRPYNAKIGLSTHVDRTAGEIQVRGGLNRDVQLHVVCETAGGGSRLGAGLKLARQSSQIEILSESQGIESYFAFQGGRLGGSNQVELTVKDKPHGILVANANLIGFEDNVHLQVWTISDQAGRRDLAASRFSGQLSNTNLVVVDVQDPVKILDAYGGIRGSQSHILHPHLSLHCGMTFGLHSANVEQHLAGALDIGLQELKQLHVDGPAGSHGDGGITAQWHLTLNSQMRIGSSKFSGIEHDDGICVANVNRASVPDLQLLIARF